MLRPAHGVRRVGGDDLTGDQPVEQHAYGGEVLLHRWLFEAALHRFDVGRDVQRLDIGELADLVLVAPVKEPDAGPVIRHARVLVADRRGEEFQEAARRSATRTRAWRITGPASGSLTGATNTR